MKPFVWQDERIGAVTRDARLLFIGLITMADDEGRFLARPAVVCGHAFPFDDDALKKVERWMSELSDIGLIELYGDNYGWFPKWESHQRISHRTPSLFPSPSGGVPE